MTLVDQRTIGTHIMTNLALHHFTIVDASVAELIDIAATLACHQVCVFVDEDVSTAAVSFPCITPANVKTVCQQLKDTGVIVTNIEYFPLTDTIDWDLLKLKLELGAQLGARLAVTHIHDPEPARATAHLAELCEMALFHGLEIGLEFMGLTPANANLESACAFVAAANQPNLGVAIDALHLHRTGGSVSQLAAVDPTLIAYVQLCDGLLDPPLLEDMEAYRQEAFERMLPGDGEMPLAPLIQTCPENTWFDVEAPRPSLAKTVPALQRARQALTAARHLLIES